MVTIYLENNELDINEGFSQQITYAVDDLQNLDSKSTAFSKTIVIPGTANNNKLFGNIFEFTNSNFTGDGPNVGYNFNASKAAKVRLEINGLTAIKGVLRLLTIIHDGENIEYEVAIFGELGGFVNALGNKKLEDLDFSVYDHIYSVANIEASWEPEATYPFDMQFIVSGNYLYINQYNAFNLSGVNVGQQIVISGSTSNDGTYIVTETYFDVEYYGPDGVYYFWYARFKLDQTITYEYGNFDIQIGNKGFGYYYPLIDYGLVSFYKQNYRYNAFRPALYVREYLDKIITDAGYTYESNFFDSDFFKRLIIPNNQQNLQYYQTEVATATFPNSYGAGYYTSAFIDFTGFSSALFSIASNRLITYNGSVGLNVIFNLNFSFNVVPDTSYNPNGFFGFQIFLYYDNPDPNFADNQYSIYNLKTSKIGGPLNYSLNLKTDPFVIEPGQTIYFKVLVSEIASLDFTNANFILESNENTYVPVVLGDDIKLNQLIPKNIFQKDFFTSILKMFYLMVTEDKDRNNHLIIEPWVEFYNLSRSSYLDWSDKIDRSQPIKIVPMSEINSRYYNINFKSDSDYFNEDYKKKFNEGYGNVIFDNQLDFAKDSSTTEVIFSATPLVGYEDEDKVVSTIFKWDGSNPNNEERVSSNIRILQSKLIEGVNSWSILQLDGSTIIDTYTKYPYAGHFDDPDVPTSDLQFGIPKQLYFTLAAGALGNNLFNTYYSSYLSEITDKDSRLVIAKIKLNEQDIFNLDFGRFIWIDGVLYRLSKIIDYSAGEICTIELLRVIYTTYQTGSPAQTECITTEDSICITTEDNNNLTIE
jgi:hypothetical protein